MMKYPGLWGALAGLMISGCATTTNFSEEGFPREDADLEVYAVQQEVGTATTTTNLHLAATAGFGVVGGLLVGDMLSKAIDGSRNDAAMQALVGLRDHLIDYDLSTRFAQLILSSPALEGLAPNADPTVVQVRRSNEDQAAGGRTRITIQPLVYFSNDIRSLVVELTVVELKPKGGATRYFTGAQQSYFFNWPLQGGDDMGRLEAAAAWKQRSQRELIALIEKGMESTLHLLEVHLAQGEVVFEGELVQVDGLNSRHLRVWQQHDDMTWVANRTRYGPLYAVPTFSIR